MVDTKSLASLLAEHPLFEGFDPDTMAFIGGCATNHHFPIDSFLFHADAPAETFYLLREGDVALQLEMPGRRRLVVQSIHPGQIAGASWILPPYRWRFDARAVSAVRAIGIDAACLRDKCDDNPGLGYRLFKRFLPVVADRLLAARMQLMDLYAPPAEIGTTL